MYEYNRKYIFVKSTIFVIQLVYKNNKMLRRLHFMIYFLHLVKLHKVDLRMPICFGTIEHKVTN